MSLAAEMATMISLSETYRPSSGENKPAETDLQKSDNCKAHHRTPVTRGCCHLLGGKAISRVLLSYEGKVARMLVWTVAKPFALCAKSSVLSLEPLRWPGLCYVFCLILGFVV